MLTAKGSEYDKVTGLDMGADDYIAKPFGMMELISRIKAVLRRYKEVPVKSPDFVVGPLRVNPQKHIVEVNGEPVVLSFKEFELLCALLEADGVVLSRDAIYSRIWGYEFDGENRTVDVHVTKLRRKLGEAGNLIETVKGIGYKIGGVKNEIKNIFSSCLVAFTVLIISLAMSTGVLFNQFEKQVEQELKEESELLASVTEDAGVENISDYDFGSRRVTVIGNDGGVLFDSQADASQMENHSDREEFKEAVLYGTGMSSRYSDTLTEKNIYYAVRLSDGSILRLSAPQSTIFAFLSDLIGPICIVILIALILSAVLAIKLSESILSP